MNEQDKRYSNQSSNTTFQPQAYRQSGFEQVNPGRAEIHSSSAPNTPDAQQPLVGVIDQGFGAGEHGAEVVKTIAQSNPQSPAWLGGGVGNGTWANSLNKFVDAAKTLGKQAVANLSFDLTEKGSDGSVRTRSQLTKAEQQALTNAHDNGVLIVASSGNQGGSMSALGQASQQFDNIIAVGAADGNHRAHYSSFGTGLDLVAPGRQVGDSFAGTSRSAAEVTGTISQMWTANPTLDYRQVSRVLEATATDLQTPGWDAETGAGLLNSRAAVSLAEVITPDTQLFSGAQLLQQVNGSFNDAPWTSQNGAIASERTNREFEGESVQEDERLRANYRAQTQAKQQPPMQKDTPKAPVNKEKPLSDTWSVSPNTWNPDSDKSKHRSQPVRPGGSDLQKKLIDVAKSYEGVRESGNDRGSKVAEFQKSVGQVGEPWCMDFAQYCIKQVEGVTNAHSNILRSGRVIDVWKNAQKHGMDLSRPELGSLAIFKWEGGQHHVGIVTSVDRNGKGFTTIEGNTTNPNGSGSEGVFEKHRRMNSTVLGFVRPWKTTSGANSGGASSPKPPATKDKPLISDERAEIANVKREQFAKSQAINQAKAKSDFETYPEVKAATGWTSRNDSNKVAVGVAHNMRELGVASLTNKQVVYLQGELLDAIKKDPDMILHEQEIVKELKLDSRYGKQSFTTYGREPVGFGGQRDGWLSLDTAKVGANKLTWALRNATVNYKAEVDAHGEIQIQYRLHDRLDLSPQEGRDPWYNAISTVTGLGYHDALGGNENLQTRAEWGTTA